MCLIGEQIFWDYIASITEENMFFSYFFEQGVGVGVSLEPFWHV